MKEPYGKGPASHPGPESCRPRREARAEALTGGHAGTEIEPRNNPLRDADGVALIGRPWLCRRYTPAGKASRAVEGPSHA